MSAVLIIDDDAAIRELLAMHLEERGYRVLTAATGAEGERIAAEDNPVAVVLDVQLPDQSGLDLISRLRAASDAPVLIVTAFHDMATTILAMRAGAFDFIRKPVDIEAFDRALDRALEERRVSSTARAFLPGDDPVLHDIVGRSPRMQEIFKEIGKVSASRASVLIRGESGTGKELIARVVHHYSTPDKPFVAVNCAAIVESLLESELFGHERGAFTGAVAQKPGKCELAADGTLFLDEIGDMSLGLQAKLLRVIQEREFERVGGVRRIPLRARIVAASHRDLTAAVGSGAFREDLYQRLRVVTLELPALRERREDIPLLVQHLLGRINARLGRRVVKVPPEVLAELSRRDWLGNVRELENTLIRAVVMAPGDVLLPEFVRASGSGRDATPATATAAPPSPARIPTLVEVEKAHVAHVLQLTGGHLGQTSEILGIDRKTLRRKLLAFGLVPPRRRARG